MKRILIAALLALCAPLCAPNWAIAQTSVDAKQVTVSGTPLPTILGGKVSTSITLTAGTGLTGGGDLSTNRSFAINFGTTSGTVAQGNDSRITGACLITGCTYTGMIVLAGDPTTNLQAATKEYVDAQVISGGGGGSVSAGTGLSLSGSTISLANTAVTPGTYGDGTHIPTITFNAQGEATAASQTAITLPGAATSSVLGLVKPDGASILNTAGAISVTSVSVPYTNPLSGSVARTVNARLQDTLSVKDQGAVGNGSTNDAAAFAAAASVGKTVLVPPGNYLINTDETIPAGVILDIDAGATIVVGSGHTLTIHGLVLAPDKFIFTGSGTVTGIRASRAAWWGAVMDYNTSAGTFTTNNTGPINACIASVNGSSFSDGDERKCTIPRGDGAISGAVVMSPDLNDSVALEGSGPYVNDSRLWSTGGNLTVSGPFVQANANSNARWVVRNLGVFAGTGTTSGPLIIVNGSGLTSGATLNGLHENLMEDVSVSATNIGILIQNARAFRFSRVDSGCTASACAAWLVTRNNGAGFTGDGTFDGIVGNATGSGGKAFSISNDDTDSASDGEIRGLSWNNSQFFAGAGGIAFQVFCATDSTSGKARSMGDYFMVGKTQLEGHSSGGTIDGGDGLQYEIKGGCTSDTVRVDDGWTEAIGASGTAFHVAVLADTHSVFGKIRDFVIGHLTAKFSIGRIVDAEGVDGLTILDGYVFDCGNGSSPTEAVLINNATTPRVANIRSLEDSGSGWSGYATGLTISGVIKNGRFFDNAVGVTTAESHSGATLDTDTTTNGIARNALQP